MMRWLLPRSIISLLMLAALVLALPIAAALVYQAFTLEGLVAQSQSAVIRANRASQGAQMLFRSVEGIRDSARRYATDPAPEYFAAFEAERTAFAKAVAEMSGKQATPQELELLGKLKATTESVINGFLNDPKEYDIESLTGAKSFAEMITGAQRVTDEVDRAARKEVEALATIAEDARERLKWHLVAMVPLLIVVTVAFFYFIARPLRDLRRAIRNLGYGRLDKSVSVAGPEDMVRLGTQLEWLRQRLKEVETEKLKFLQHVSHELKTPLTALREGSQLLSEEVLGKLNTEQRDVARILRESAVAMHTLIERLLNYNHMLHQRTSFEFKPVQFDAIISRVTDQQRVALMPKQINLEVDCVEVIVEGDEDKLRAVVDNLVSNAIKFSPQGGRIAVRLKNARRAAVLDVIDQGPGIKSGEEGKIFEPFFQGSHRPSGPVKGTGLGLSIVREYVTAHRGRIEVIADQPGAHFRVVIPKTAVMSEAA